MSRDLHAAASVTPPISGSDDLLVLASSATASRYRIPRTWLRSWVTVEADGADAYVAFTQDSTLALDGTDVTTLDGSFDISAHGTAEGEKVADGVPKHYDLSKLPALDGEAADESWYLAHVESATGGYLRIRRTSGPAAE